MRNYSKELTVSGTNIQTFGHLGKTTGHGKDSEKEKKYLKIIESYIAIEQAGKELALFGEISKKTQKIASQDIIPIPFFSILKNFKWFKKIAIEKIKD